MSGALAAGTSVPAAASALQASPANSWAVTLLPGRPGPTSSPEDNGDPSEGRSELLTTAQTDKLLADVLARHTQSFEAADAFDDLNHGLLLARERGDEVPCVGPGAEAWTSEEAVDQELAADLCLLCPVFALCQRYAEAAQPDAGTWAGVTREPSARERRRRSIAEAHERRQGKKHTRIATTGDREPRSRRARLCSCGCGQWTRGGRYASGHDSVHIGALLRGVREGALSLDAALTEVAHSEKLQAKLAARLGR